MIKLNGFRALVTGSTAGIGYAIAKRLATTGATVTINGRTQDRVDAAIEKMRAEAGDININGVAADVGTAEGCTALIAAVPDVDILVNNTGIFAQAPFGDIADEDWMRFFEVNVMSGVRLSRHYVKNMLNRGWGRVVFISSESALHIPPEMVHYGMTKTAQLAVARGLAETYPGTGVTVNSVLPGPTLSEGVTAMFEQMSETQGRPLPDIEAEFIQQNRPTSVIQRMLDPEEVANLVTYVCSREASGTTGTALRVDGGLVRAIP